MRGSSQPRFHLEMALDPRAAYQAAGADRRAHQPTRWRWAAIVTRTSGQSFDAVASNSVDQPFHCSSTRQGAGRAAWLASSCAGWLR
jgi:hypothetical protein